MRIIEAIVSFNSGELSPLIDSRNDVEKYRSGCRRLENMIPTKYGAAVRRPGTKFIYNATLAPNGTENTVIRRIPFIYSSEIAYTIEFGNHYARFYYGDSVLLDESQNEVWIQSPYAEEDLYELQYKQVADTIRITHPKYPIYILKRTDVYTFTLEELNFKNGPFLTRNDLVNPEIPSTTTLQCNVINEGAVGILTANMSIFLPGHEGALFKLCYPRTNKHVYLSGSGTTEAIYGKGTYNLITRGTWTGTITWQRSDNNSDWETFKEWKSSLDAYQSINASYKETSEYAKHRITATASAALQADFSIDEPLESGIVKVISVIDSYRASVKVMRKLASTSPTKRWHEGAWSYSRGFPSTVCFFEGRCVYAGACLPLSDEEFSAYEYPDLRT